MSNKLMILVLLVLPALTLQAQDYEIRAVNKGGGVVAVEMRVTAGTVPGTAYYITDLVFGLKWLASYNVDLENTLTTSYGIVKSDVRKTRGAYHYQAFYADNTPFLFPADWSLNTWVEILSVRNTLTGQGTGMFEVAEAGFDVTTDPNLGISLVDEAPFVAASAVEVALPVHLLSFEVAPRQHTIVVQWATDLEEQVKGFEVERADQQDPTHFKTVATLPGKGPAGGQYEWTDAAVTGGVRYYYRLKQVDLDGKFRYSEVRSASLDDTGIVSVRLLPNPVDKELRLLFKGAIRTDRLLIRITDAGGRVVMLKEHRVSTGRSLTLQVASLVQGQYFLTVEEGKEVLAVKPFFKQ